MIDFWQFYSELVRNPYLSYFCMGFILLASFITKGVYKLIPVIFLCEFTLSKLCFVIGRVETNLLFEYKLFIAYSICSLLAILALEKLKLSLIAITILAISTIYNVFATLSYFFYDKFISIYAALPEFIGTIMIIETLFCLFMWAYVEFNLRKYGNINGYNHMRRNYFLRSQQLVKLSNRSMV